MSHFYASIQGTRGEATRCGDKNNGIRGHIRGWDIGVNVHGGHNDVHGDIFTVSITSGSNRSGKDLFLGKWKLNKDGVIEHLKEC